MDLVGSIYLPTQKLDLGGGGGLSLTSSSVPLVAFRVDVRGDNLSLSLDKDLFPGDPRVPMINELVRLIDQGLLSIRAAPAPQP